MQAKKVFKLFDDLYEVYYNLEDEDMLVPFLEGMPTLNDFDYYCETWNIPYEIKKYKEVNMEDTLLSFDEEMSKDEWSVKLLLKNVLLFFSSKTILKVVEDGETKYVGSPMVALETPSLYDLLDQEVMLIQATDTNEVLVKL